MSARAPVAVLVPTLNEEKNLPACLHSVRWAAEIFVVDSCSTDSTREIAAAAKANFVEHAFENYAAQKNWALQTLPISQPWILILDADERVSPDLAREIAAVVAAPNPCDGYYINRRFMFMGRWLRHCGWYPSWNLRLFRRGHAHYEQRPVHEHMVVQGSVGYLQNDLIHADERGLAAWLQRHNHYSTLEAQARAAAQTSIKTGLEPGWLGSPVQRKRVIKELIWPHLPAKPLLWFVYMYILRAGFLDGRQGFSFCVLQAMQEHHIGLKLRELRESK